jgi:hypothetical protein
MSDTTQGPGWWLASDGKWYPPELHPNYTPPPSPTTSDVTERPPEVAARPPTPGPDDHVAQLLEVTTSLRLALLQFAGEVERLEGAIRSFRPGP